MIIAVRYCSLQSHRFSPKHPDLRDIQKSPLLFCFFQLIGGVMPLKSSFDLDALFQEDPSDVRQRQETQFDAAIDESRKTVVIFGAGNLGRKVLKCLREDGIEPRAFTDNNPRLWGTNIDGVPILSPEQASQEFGTLAVFIVAIFSPGNPIRQIIRQLTELECVSIIPYAVAAWKYADLRPHFSIDLPEVTYRQQAAIRQAASLFADEESQKEYLAQLRFRIFGSFDGLSDLRKEPQYFPHDLFRLTEKEVFIDCGAFIGDTLEGFLQECEGKFSRFIAIEPDPMNYSKLQDMIQKMPAGVQEKIRPVQIASGSTRGTVRFDASGTGSSAVNENGTIPVDVAPLDEIATETPPTYIKMDIEGAEMDTLLGAQDLIRNHQPKLAICVYHRPDDLWKIPLWIHQVCPGYRLFLRSYNELLDVVCYAIP
ncbi:MAG TPA: FkbM family methyltransferase [Anaerolineaceae bacterium]|nr:FkbM family methyltransferase [Anaerolineaceae bacterium]